ncbi:PREDICTED: zinc carboxypeptidase-like [Ceratosolen solmsi marchali]|uniref:Zinc carboxypeptidase-like n=1 Tax=Ceratosolen solmsi marchali TaxID=326594 RepID=A0AAJ7DTF5_9HYME|nr:PREDICTED: zinc carboxypeptidase-like [Ceratosolen solmsi marchali]
MFQQGVYFLIATIIISSLNAQKVSYKNYKVYTFETSTNEHKAVILKLIYSDSQYLPWNVVHPMSLLVPPNKVQEIETVMKASNIKYKITMNDVQAVIDSQSKKVGDKNKFDWTRYHTLDEINNWLDNLSKKYPGKAEIIIAGRTYEGRQIKGIKISFKKNNPGVVLESGMHPNEWLSPATTTYIINEFLNSKDTEIRKLAETFDWYIFPSLNADGYVYSHTTDRLWRKTVSQGKSKCIGVDLNRNWGYKWAPCTIPNCECYTFYGGTKAFTEIEAITFSEYIKSISSKIFCYITFHNLGQRLVIPYGYSSERMDNYEDAISIGQKAANAISKRYGTKFIVGNFAEAFTVLPGSSMDWMKGELKVQLSYSYLLRDTGEYGYLMPPEQIIPNCQETMDSLLVLFDEMKKFGYPKKFPEIPEILNINRRLTTSG